ncbi:MAG: bifunctional ornithine acetyltransferase/N-acetylglutamate synthase [Spirochaetales bacterium]|nr:bifunctional ornithine acetyltransferase/N-acetylglutamate synthase [Spirochaetales bacterium]
MKPAKNSYILPKGFKATGFKGKIKKDKLDMAIIHTETFAVTGGVFTTNKVRAACVKRNKELLQNGEGINSIIINSGNANACTGQKGIEDNSRLAEYLGNELNINSSGILTASTGIIGVKLPMENMIKGIKDNRTELTENTKGLMSAAEAILTTDTFSKQVSVVIELNHRSVTVSGISKGSGMIHPNMATMLGFIMTDIVIDQKLLQNTLKKCVDNSFNMISVDGDTSTNDMVIVMANGEAGNRTVIEDSSEYLLFEEALLSVCTELAKLIAKDGEGATKLLEVEVYGCGKKTDAVKIAKSVIGSSLVKTAIFGEDPNWGRIIAAMGYSGADFDPERVSIHFQGAPGYVCVMKNGEPCHFDIDSAAAILKEKNVYISINLNSGNSKATAWGCDLSYDYVKINADYHT